MLIDQYIILRAHQLGMELRLYTYAKNEPGLFDGDGERNPALSKDTAYASSPSVIGIQVVLP